MNTCPHCGSSDLNLEIGICRTCGQPLDDNAQRPAEPSPASPPENSTPTGGTSLTARMNQAALNNQWETWENEVIQAHDDGFQIITLIGFSETGKTFFANRLRHELNKTRTWTAVPDGQALIPGSAAAIEPTEIVKHRGRSRRYLLADVDGEAYQGSVRHLLRESNEGVARRYVLLTALASAYVLMIPANADFAKRDDKDKETMIAGRETIIERFGVIVGVILALRQRIDQGMAIRDVILEPVTEDTSRLALRGSIQCPQPVHVLFAQADEFSDVGNQEADPYAFAIRDANRLYRTIDKHFTRHRFDFVSAFDGYKRNNEFRVDYNSPTYGTLAAFEWIDRMISGGRLFWKTTAAAKITRRLFDATFRNDITRMTGR